MRKRLEMMISLLKEEFGLNQEKPQLLGDKRERVLGFMSIWFHRCQDHRRRALHSPPGLSFSIALYWWLFSLTNALHNWEKKDKCIFEFIIFIPFFIYSFVWLLVNLMTEWTIESNLGDAIVSNWDIRTKLWCYTYIQYGKMGNNCKHKGKKKKEKEKTWRCALATKSGWDFWNWTRKCKRTSKDGSNMKEHIKSRSWRSFSKYSIAW